MTAPAAFRFGMWGFISPHAVPFCLAAVPGPVGTQLIEKGRDLGRQSAVVGWTVASFGFFLPTIALLCGLIPIGTVTFWVTLVVVPVTGLFAVSAIVQGNRLRTRARVMAASADGKSIVLKQLAGEGLLVDEAVADAGQCRVVLAPVRLRTSRVSTWTGFAAVLRLPSVDICLACMPSHEDVERWMLGCPGWVRALDAGTSDTIVARAVHKLGRNASR